MIIKTHKIFNKSYEKLSKKLKLKVNNILVIFSENFYNKSLNNHALDWEYLWLRSIDVTWDYRIIFRELSGNKYEIVELIKVWTHSQLYK